MLSHGVVDCALAQTYAPDLLVGNSGAQAEIQGATVQVVDPATNGVVTSGTALGAAAEFAAVGQVPSYATVGLTLLNSVAVSHFCPGSAGTASKTAEVQVTLFGQTLAGEAVESNELLFSVEVCYGCLVTVPDGALAGYCAGESASASSAVACVIGQDQVSDCQACSQVPFCKNLR